MEKIAIIGASEYQNALILKARAMGYETHVFAWQTGRESGEKNADFFYPISSESKEEILEKCRELGVCAVVSLGSDMAALATAYVSEKLGLTCNTYASVVCATNKLMTRNLFAKLGVLQPRYAEIGAVIPVEELDKLQYPLIVKPSDRSGGRGLTKVDDKRQLFRAINAAREISFERKAVVEEYVQGQLYSCECISYNGEHHVLGYTRRSVLNIQGKICESTYVQPAHLPLSIMKTVDKLAVSALNALAIRYGASSIEFIVDEHQDVYVIEITPSMYGDFIGTHLIPGTQGYDYLAMVIDIAAGKQPDMRQSKDVQQQEVRFIYCREHMDQFRAAPQEWIVDCDADEDRWIPDAPDGTRYGYYVIRKPYKEFGGCTAWRLPPRAGEKQFSALPQDCVQALNSEYTALWCALKQLEPQRLLMPHYTAQHWGRVAEEMGVEVVRYHIGMDFLPVDLHQQPGDAVLLVNYHAACGSFISDYAAGHEGVIIDQSMAFYAEPVMKRTVFNIYSCRKFFAVPDGAYLVSKELDVQPLERDISYKRARSLLLALELGENAAYKEHQANEQELAKERKTMSLLTEKMMDSFDLAGERNKRIENYKVLDSRLRRFQLFPLGVGDDAVPQCYPLLVNADVRSLLMTQRIYVPVMWRRFLGEAFNGMAEQMLSQRLLCLPIDPQYSVDDMEYIAETVAALLS